LTGNETISLRLTDVRLRHDMAQHEKTIECLNSLTPRETEVPASASA
jgi:FixJ family two-component response regulator